jgi:pimeloyl-ACP methyl ester carboxylesterase
MQAIQKEYHIQHPIFPHTMRYMEWENENATDTIICVHGLTRNSRDFDYLANKLSKKYRVISVDIAGRGKSDWLKDPAGYNYPNYMAFMLEFIEHLDIDRAHWIGTSMGGLIGMMLSATKPGFIQNFVINDIGPFIQKESLQRISKYIRDMPKFRDHQHAEEHLKVKLAQFGIRKDEDWQYITKHSTMLNNSNELVFAYDPAITKIFTGKSADNITDIDIWEIWEKVNFKKMLILRGANSDLLLPETAQKMIDTKKNVQMVEFKNVGHAPALMEGDQIQVVLDWMDGL